MTKNVPTLTNVSKKSMTVTAMPLATTQLDRILALVIQETVLRPTEYVSILSFFELLAGFYGDGKICGDSDECSADIYQLATLDNTTDLYNLAASFNSTLEHSVTATHDCHDYATCNNTIGSFYCECNLGKRLLTRFEVHRYTSVNP